MFHGMEYVYEVYKERSFSKAAQNLFVSQPSLSATVKRVEQRIGYPIFDRSTKPLQLTECGERYIQAVQRILMAENEFSDYVNDWGGLRTGHLVLGGSNLFSSWLLPALMARFAHRFPGVRLELVEESTGHLEQSLQRGDVDLIIDNALLDPEVFDCDPLQEETLLLAVPRAFAVNEALLPYQVPVSAIRNHSFSRESFPVVPLSAFAGEPFILLKPENHTRTLASRLLEEAGVTPRVIFELDQQMTSYNITCSGMGISFIGNTLIVHVTPNPDVIYYKLGGENSRRMLYFYWKRGRYMSKAMEQFLALAHEEAL